MPADGTAWLVLGCNFGNEGELLDEDDYDATGIWVVDRVPPSAPQPEVQRFMLQVADALRQANIFPRSISTEFGSDGNWFSHISSQQRQQIVSWAQVVERSMRVETIRWSHSNLMAAILWGRIDGVSEAERYIRGEFMPNLLNAPEFPNEYAAARDNDRGMLRTWQMGYGI
ncbi:hypothetical protein B0T14DRAFT_568194 [Immersiella caudata]|uniref:Uncharacterized protein n=1 Tax=Immersiella caudata TaxID=314043 RepID=A0AA39WJN5_9PEZI|nr:hypothetical protein B0T14DRAFT_568194 [Immersiella caudata]